MSKPVYELDCSHLGKGYVTAGLRVQAEEQSKPHLGFWFFPMMSFSSPHSEPNGTNLIVF